MKDCVFCKIVKNELPADFILEESGFVVFRDVKPIAPVHVLLVPRKHIVNLAGTVEEDKEVLGEIQMAVKKVAEKLGISDCFRLLVANGKDAGQTVFHLHYHLIGGWKNKKPDMEVMP